jgi:hypothetical protein
MNLIASFYEDHGDSSTCATYLICTVRMLLSSKRMPVMEHTHSRPVFFVD